MIKSKFYATLDNGKTVDLPYTYETIQQAATWLDNHSNAASIHERLAVVGTGYQTTYKIYDVTDICLDVLSTRVAH